MPKDKYVGAKVNGELLHLNRARINLEEIIEKAQATHIDVCTLLWKEVKEKGGIIEEEV